MYITSVKKLHCYQRRSSQEKYQKYLNISKSLYYKNIKETKNTKSSL